MPRMAVDENQRMSLRLLQGQKALLPRAVILRSTD